MTGSLQIKNGKYYAVLNLKDENGKRKVKWINTNYDVKGNKRKAEQFLQRQLIKFENDETIRKDILFCDYMLMWLNKMKNELEVSTWSGYMKCFEKHIYPYFSKKKIKLDEVTAKHIKAYYDLKISEGLSAMTVKRHHANIRKCLQTALCDDLITSNPADKVQLPRTQKFNAKYFDADQVRTILEQAQGLDIEMIIVLCSYYGLRRSEVLGLKWNAVSFNNDTIRIYNTITSVYEISEKERTKNTSSNRVLPLIPVVKEYLIKLKRQQEENKRLFGNCYNDNDYVCIKADGTPIRPDEASHKFSSFLKNYGFPHIRLHDLRHSCASMLIAQGVDIKVIQEWLGHSSIATTGNIYGHLQFKQKVATGEMLGTLLSNNVN